MNTLISRIKIFNQELLPAMVQLKYKAMSENPFRFYRGTAHLFYEDLAAVKKFPASPSTWICGDLHLENFGSFKGNNRQEYFDLNDFDEAILAPLNWELARILTSIYVAFDTLGIRRQEADEMAHLFLDTYTKILKEGKAHYIDPRTADGIVHDFLKTVKKRKEKDLVQKFADDHTFKIDNRMHLAIEPGQKKELIHYITQWIKSSPSWPRHYKVLDAAFRVAGTGSIGLKRYMFLLQSTRKKKRYLMVELKAARASALAPYVKIAQPAWSSEAERINTVKKRMQNISPALSTAVNFNNENYVLQEMQPMADKIDFAIIRDRYKCIERVIEDMAIVTASAQLRSGGIQGSAIIDELTAYAGKTTWHKPLISYAQKYALQVLADYETFKSAWLIGLFRED